MAVLAVSLFAVAAAQASTYVVYIPLDSPIYDELDTLNGLGVLDSYLPEIKPISRVEAARLTIEARHNLAQQRDTPNPLAEANVNVLREQLAQEIDWLQRNEEDGLPTMVRPVERMQLQYVYAAGERRKFYMEGAHPVTVAEPTPLLPNHDALPTDNGNNGAAIWSGWAGVGGFLTGYADGALAGPLQHDPHAPDRDRIVAGAVVASLGNVALSFGNEEMQWGVGHFGQLSQSNNASAFPALRLQNVHPSHLPGVLRYLGLFRWQLFIGQLDSDRAFSHPWIDGEIVSFKPLPNFEFGFTHTIDFGGSGNDDYSALGFLGRATGFATGNPGAGNTNTRVSAYASLRIPRLRYTQIYGEILGEDFYQPFGHQTGPKLPFKSPSYQLGFYLPRLTRDGLTDMRVEWALLDRNYSTHNDSLYWAYDSAMMGYPLGPRAQRVDLAFERWISLEYKLGIDGFYEFRDPISPVSGPDTERGEGFNFDVLRLPIKLNRLGGALADMRMRTSIEYVNNINYVSQNSVRAMLQLSFGLTPGPGAIVWR
ncbi:MAG: capsule assembly Wzi family protein [Candidatus Binataceae bacterium]